MLVSSRQKIFFRAVNGILGKVGRVASVEVVLQLIKSKCTPILLYCLEVCPLTIADKHSLDFSVYRVLMKLFQTVNTSVIDECRQYFGFKLPSEILLSRSCKYIAKHNARF